MSKMKDFAIQLDNVEKLATDTLRNAAVLEQEYFLSGDSDTAQHLFEQVTLPLHQILAYLRNGEESDYV